MKKLTYCLILILISLIVFTPLVKASGFEFTATPNASSANVGDNVTITISLSNIDIDKIGINTIYTVLKFDEDIFEYVSSTGKNNWSLNFNNIQSNEQYGTLLATITEAGITEEQEIGEITFKIKDKARGKEGKINFTQISTNNGINKIYDEDEIVDFKILGGSSNQNFIIITCIICILIITVISTIAVVIHKKRK